MVDPAPSGEGLFQASVVSGADDGREYSTGIVRTNESFIYLGRGNLAALRFRDVDVPQGAVIQSAVLELYGFAALNSSVAIRYTAEDAGDSAPFKTVTRNLSSRQRTQASVDDVPGSWTLGTFNASPDLRAVVQEVVGRPDWDPGQSSLTLFIEDGDSFGTRRIGSFEGSPSPTRAARLTILYEVP